MGRYEIVRRLDGGNSADVWLARDDIGGAHVVLKRPLALRPQDIERARREALALRLLQFPGVIPILDEGRDELGWFLVTRFVDGVPFPGPGGPADLEIVTARLLEILGRVHAAGVVHRDLKPSNVLVDRDGRPWLLDFGLARGRPLGETMTAEGAWVGTPRYLAPECAFGGPVDPRADLYSLGIMLYEALTGAPPFADDDPPMARLLREVPPLADRRSDAPAGIGRLVDALCARLAEDRPPSAAAAIALLDRRRPAPTLVWAGPRDSVETLVRAALAGRPCDLRAEPGIGRTRALEEAARALEAEGRTILWSVAGQRPLSSLRASFGLAERLDPTQCRAAAAERLDAGVVLVVDPPSAVDRWSREMLLEIGGPILGLGGALVELAPLTEEAIRDLFHGPDRVLHYRDDGAAALFHRTRGNAARIAEHVSAWIEGGLAVLDGGRIRITADQTQRLRDSILVSAIPSAALPSVSGLRNLLGWLTLSDGALDTAALAQAMGIEVWEIGYLLDELVEAGLATRDDGVLRAAPIAGPVLHEWSTARRERAHRALAARLPAGSRARLVHLVQGGEIPGAAEEAVVIAGDLARAGRFTEAFHLLEMVLAAQPGALSRERERSLLGSLVTAAISTERVELRTAALHRVERADCVRRGDGWLLDLAQEAVANASRRFDTVERLASPFPVLDPALDIARISLLVEGRNRRDPPGADAEVERWRAWAEQDPDRHGAWLTWAGLAAYRAGRFAEAAELHRRARLVRRDEFGRLVAEINEATAALEAPDLERARAAAASVVSAAAALRLPSIEIRAWTILRGVAYRSGGAPREDRELVDAAQRLGSSAAAAPLLLGEGTIAWRAGANPEALELLAAARDRYAGFTAGVLACDVLLAVLGATPAAPAAWEERLSPLLGSRLGKQLWAVLTRAGIPAGPPPGPIAGCGAVRFEFLSPDEINEAIRGGSMTTPESRNALASELSEGVHLFKIDIQGTEKIVAIVSVRRTGGRLEYWDLVEDVAESGGASLDPNYDKFSRVVIGGSGPIDRLHLVKLTPFYPWGDSVPDKPPKHGSYHPELPDAQPQTIFRRYRVTDTDLGTWHQ